MKQQANVTERALLQRCNRALAHMGEKVFKNRSSKWYSTVGNYYCVDIFRNAISSSHSSLEQLARELGCLREWEKLEELD